MTDLNAKISFNFCKWKGPKKPKAVSWLFQGAQGRLPFTRRYEMSSLILEKTANNKQVFSFVHLCFNNNVTIDFLMQLHLFIYLFSESYSAMCCCLILWSSLPVNMLEQCNKQFLFLIYEVLPICEAKRTEIAFPRGYSNVCL